MLEREACQSLSFRVYRRLAKRLVSGVTRSSPVHPVNVWTISDAIKSELKRLNSPGKSSTKASMLYLTILNETRTMVLQLRNLLKAQRHFLETKGVIKSWLYYAK